MGNLVRPGPLFCLAGLAPQSQGRGAAACDTVASSALFSDGPCPARQVRAVPAGVSAPVADCARARAAGPGRGRREPGARQPPAAGLCAAAGPQHGVCGALRPRCAWALRGTDCTQQVHCMRSGVDGIIPCMPWALLGPLGDTCAACVLLPQHSPLFQQICYLHGPCTACDQPSAPPPARELHITMCFIVEPLSALLCRWPPARRPGRA